MIVAAWLRAEHMAGHPDGAHGDDNTRYGAEQQRRGPLCGMRRHAPRRAATPGPELLLRANNALVTGLRIMQILRRGPGKEDLDRGVGGAVQVVVVGIFTLV